MVMLYGTVLNYAGQPASNEPVTISTPGAYFNGSRLRTFRVYTDADGDWSVDLPATRYVLPEQTYYAVRTSPTQIDYIQIPDYVSTISLEEAKAVPPVDKYWSGRKPTGQYYHETPWEPVALNPNMQNVLGNPCESRVKHPATTARLRGAMEHIGPAVVPAGTTLGTVSVYDRPEKLFRSAGFTLNTLGNPTFTVVSVTQLGEIYVTTSFPPGDTLYLDNITYVVSLED